MPAPAAGGVLLVFEIRLDAPGYVLNRLRDLLVEIGATELSREARAGAWAFTLSVAPDDYFSTKAVLEAWKRNAFERSTP